MSIVLVIKILEALANIVSQIVGLFDGACQLSKTDVVSVHAALTKAETATAALRPHVDAALEQAAAR
jgi:hypothetical protein